VNTPCNSVVKDLKFNLLPDRFRMIKTTKITTPLGEMIAAATGDGICFLAFGDNQDLHSELKVLAELLDTDIKEGRHKYLRQVKKELKEYFTGKRKEFSVSLVTPGSEFQKAVWNVLLNIPYGTIISYQQQADILKNPGSVRAVAHANGMNRIAVIIPCHRVIGSDGKLVGYGGGLDRKRWLINHEKKHSGKSTDLELF
jgi:AraC family transcriptional regulator of adaptative response/methylated-DNA-[protein]-cysteine methyltransferase